MSIPDLQHTGIRTDFTYQGSTFLRPDGSVSRDLRNEIRTKQRNLPRHPVADALDMAHLDTVRSIRRSDTLQLSASSVIKDQALAQGIEEPGSLATS